MKDTDAAWLAGFLDGEGSFGVSPKKNTNKSIHYNPELYASNTNLALIHRMRELTGGSFVVRKRYSPKWKTAYQCVVKGPKLTPVLEAVLPYLVSKREQCSLLLELRSTTRSRGGQLLPQHVLEARVRIYERVRELNTRGVSTPPS